MAEDIESLLRASRGGDSAALGRLLEAYRNYLHLLARIQIGRRLQGKVDPSDLVQDTFLEAQRAFPEFQGDSERTLAAWLRQILIGQIAHLVRRFHGTQARAVTLEQTLAQELDASSDLLERAFIDSKDSPSESAVRREHAVLLADAIGSLPDDYRETIILRQFEGLSFAEVAQRMGRSVDSVQKLWLRSLHKLRGALKEQGLAS